MEIINNIIRNLISKKFIACLFSILIIAIMGVWCLYKLSEALALQAFISCVGAIVAIFIAYAIGNVIGDHVYNKKEDNK